MKTVTLIGSSRFDPTTAKCEALLTGLGIIVLTHGYHVDEPVYENPAKRRPVYDLQMYDKIQQSDYVLCVDVTDESDQVVAGKGYVGEETAREILWTAMNEITIYFLSDLLACVLKSGGLATAMADLADSVIDGEGIPLHVDGAVDLLERATGQERTEAAMDDTKLKVMHAVLSHFCLIRPDTELLVPVNVRAKQALDFVGLEIMPNPEKIDYLRMIDPASSIHEQEPA